MTGKKADLLQTLYDNLDSVLVSDLKIVLKYLDKPITGKTKLKADIIKEIKHIIFNNSCDDHDNYHDIIEKNTTKSIPKSVRDEVYNTKCMCCNINEIKSTNFQCGPVVSTAMGGKTIIDNLRPVCQPCNLSMGTMSMTEWCERYYPNAPFF